jgi:glycosyltransferase involved in cell wall biosynthesis
MKPRLLIIHNRLVVGGPALDTIPLAYHLRNDFDIHILYGCKEADETEPSFLLEKYKGLKLVKVGALKRRPGAISDLKAYRFIRKYISTFQPHIVHTHGAKAGLFGRIAARRAQVPMVVHTFHGHLFHSYFNRPLTSMLVKLERRLLRYTHHIIAISQAQKTELEQILAIQDPGKVKLIPLGVDYIDSSMKDHYKQAFRRTYNGGVNTVNIGILGRLVPIKNLSFFLEIVSEVLKQNGKAEVRFFVVGDGHEKKKMMRYLQQHQVPYTESFDNDKPVVFTSWIQNIQNVLEGLDIVVLTSLNEGTPMSLIEAQICGKPVVAVDVGGVRDTMVDGETGILIKGHDLPAFSAAINRLVRNPGLREDMGRKAASFASTTFSKEREIGSLRSLYQSHN